MQMRRVVITGTGAVTPFGLGAGQLADAVFAGKSALSLVPELQEIGGLDVRVAGLVRGVDTKRIPRAIRRSMSPMSMHAFLAATEALTQANVPEPMLHSGKLGVAAATTVASVETMEEFFQFYLQNKSIEQVKSMLFFRIMAHSVAANLAQSLGITGRVLSPAAACSTGCQSVGLAYETIAFGLQDAMLCGGAEEFHPLTAGTFSILGAASTAYAHDPAAASRPFDAARDGMVCAEGAGMLFLESLESALARKANILAEIKGFSCLTDPSNLANPAPEPLANCMRQVLDQSQLQPEAISYINAHATGTILGDLAEAEAIAAVFGDKVPVSSLKGHLGHTLAASGSLELILSLDMMRLDRLVPTKNLQNIDERCAPIQLLQHTEHRSAQYILKNSFALGGVNCCLLIGRYND